MTVGIDCELMHLHDMWPGAATPGANPDDWTELSTTEDFPLGTKRMIYDDTNQGWATLIYLYYTNGAGTVAVATVSEIVGQDTSAAATKGQWCHVTNDGSDVLLKGPLAICLGTMVTARYGWFWCGGVCPVDTIAGLGTALAPSDGGVDTAMNWMTIVDSASIAKFHIAAATDFQNFSAFTMVIDTTS
jgi:hypothetical protein